MQKKLMDVFEEYLQSLKSPLSQREKRYAFSFLTDFLEEYYGRESLKALMEIGDTSSWEQITRESIERFISWLAMRGFSAQTIAVRTNGIRQIYKRAAEDGYLSEKAWEQIKAVPVNELTRKAVEGRPNQRLTTRKERRVPLGMEQVALLKQQPDTPQGRRDALLLCLLLDHRLSVKVIEALPVQALDLQKRVLHPSSDREIVLSEETLEVARRYIEQDAPQHSLIQGSKKGGILQGKMGARAQADRVRVLGKRIGVPSLSPQDCQLWAKPVQRFPKATSPRMDKPLLVPESIILRREDPRPRYSKNRLILEVIEAEEGEDIVHYLGYDLFWACNRLSTLQNGQRHFTTVLNCYQ